MILNNFGRKQNRIAINHWKIANFTQNIVNFRSNQMHFLIIISYCIVILIIFQTQQYLRQMKENAGDIDCVFDGLDGIGAIYVSDFSSASLTQIRTSLRIKAVVSIASRGYLQQHHELVDYLYIPALDTDVYQIHKHFEETFNFIDKHRRHGNVLVHCMVGKSRSATIVAAYLLKKFKYSLSTVMNLLKRKRKKINPNPGFMKQLCQYCRQIGVELSQETTRCRSINNFCTRAQFQHKNSSIDKHSVKNSQFTAESESDKIQKQQQNEQNEIQAKIQKIRQKYLKGGQLKQRKRDKKIYNFSFKQVNSTTLSAKNNEISIQWKQAKSAELS